MESAEYLTQEKYDDIKKELDNLVHVRRKEIAEHLEYAKSLGDLSENAEYHEARDEQANIEDRINKIESVLKSALIMPTPHDTHTVTVGSVVIVEKESDSSKKTYTLVGSEESDMNVGKISIKSPVGMAMLGKKKKEKFTVKAPSGNIVYVILDIK